MEFKHASVWGEGIKQASTGCA